MLYALYVYLALKAAILHQEGKLIIQTGYNLLLVRLLNTLPKLECIYRDETNSWYIDPKHEPLVLSWLTRFGYAFTDVDADLPVGDSSYSVLGLLPSAIDEVCDAAYKALVKKFHPDLGGNPEMMKQINAAWDRIKLARGQK